MKRFTYTAVLPKSIQIEMFGEEVKDHIKKRCGATAKIATFTKLIAYEYRATFSYSFTEDIGVELEKIKERYHNGK